MLRTLLIGDIHGCYQELLNLIDQAGLTAADWVIALGDFVCAMGKPFRNGSTCWGLTSYNDL